MKKFWDDAVRRHLGEDGGQAGRACLGGGLGRRPEIACMATLVMLMNFGFLVFGVTDYVAHRFTLHYGATIPGEPRREEEIAACARVGERLAQWVVVYCDGRASCIRSRCVGEEGLAATEAAGVDPCRHKVRTAHDDDYAAQTHCLEHRSGGSCRSVSAQVVSPSGAYLWPRGRYRGAGLDDIAPLLDDLNLPPHVDSLWRSFLESRNAAR